MQGRYSEDGRWWWDGTQWVPAPGTGAPVAAHYAAYAGFWIRFAGWFLDSVITIVGSAIIGFVVGVAGAVADAALNTNAVSSATSVLGQVLAVVWGWLYYSLLQSSRFQASLGQMAVGIMVTDHAGNRLSWARATGRYFASFLSGLLCGIGYLLVAFTERKQALHDMIAGTLVVHGRPVPGVATLGTKAAGAPAGGAAVALAVTGGLVLLLFPVVVIVVLLTMGSQIGNVFSNVVVALTSP